MNISALIGLYLLHTVTLHNIAINEDGWFSPGESDPFILIALLEDEKDAKGVLVRYEMSNFPEFYQTELYYETDWHGFKEKFKYSLKFKGQTYNEFYVPFEMYEEESLKAIRWDIDGCKECKFKITEISFVKPDGNQSYDLLIPVSYKPNYFVSQDKLGSNERDYHIQDFHIGGFKHLGGNVLKVNKIEPFIASPVLDFPLSQVGGVYFKLGVPPTQNETLYFRIAWQTNTFGYRNRAVFRLQNVNDKFVEMFIPFKTLSEEKLLRKFHLLFESEIGDIWTFEQIKVIPVNKIAAYSQFEPVAIASFPGAASSWFNIFKDGFRKMAKDRLFFSFYLIVLFCVIFGLCKLMFSRRIR